MLDGAEPKNVLHFEAFPLAIGSRTKSQSLDKDDTQVVVASVKMFGDRQTESFIFIASKIFSDVFV